MYFKRLFLPGSVWEAESNGFLSVGGEAPLPPKDIGKSRLTKWAFLWEVGSLREHRGVDVCYRSFGKPTI